ncbi:MAG: hypothetical protein ACLQPD_00085 [Desulfomonilaceae bacterium]
MKLLMLTLVTIALIVSAVPGSYFCRPVTVYLIPSVLDTANPGFSDAIGPDTIPGRSKYSQIGGTYRDKDSVIFLILAADDKNNGGDKNGEDKDGTEKDDKSQNKDKDEGGGWDRLWDSPMLG